MMRRRIVNVMIIGLVLATIGCAAVAVNTQKTKSFPEISTDRKISSVEAIEAHMKFLASDDLKGRNTGTDGIELAANYIEDVFKKSSVEPYFSSYKDTLSNHKKPAYNIVGHLEGNDPVLKNEYILIGAHYDHIGFADWVAGDAIANGANDNASGTTAVLELARYFAKQRINGRSLLFALFSAEEKGLLGSKHLAKRLKEENIDLYGVANFEMIGVPFNGRDYVAFVTGYDKTNMAEKMNEYAGTNLIGKSAVAVSYDLFKRSDNYPFYREFKVPSQTISTCDLTNFEYYHHVDDEIDKMDFEHMSNVIQSMIPVLEKMSTTPTKEIKLY
ncbi:M28 family metallopeptidase [Sungkyunkwania multivorans]|uniref:M28 family metallopeptidase n=1 Tax=Sungkyunkwania multivorans TaxID=1173618 RepID=A0ABW3D3E5_9FLAO